MCLSPALQSGEDIVNHQLELQSILHGVHQRYAGRRGRYNKHDTARLRFIRDKAFMGLRQAHRRRIRLDYEAHMSNCLIHP